MFTKGLPVTRVQLRDPIGSWSHQLLTPSLGDYVSIHEIWSSTSIHTLENAGYFLDTVAHWESKNS